jgi:SAM-dependent methyltransferase
MPRARGFDRLARIYRVLEFLAFGSDLERARFCFLRDLAGCRRILVLGEGDGRFVGRLLGVAEGARIRCIESSDAMIARATGRVAGVGAAERVAFERGDVLGARFAPSAYDAVVTLFFLDCFTGTQVRAIVDNVRPAMAGGARWLFADFALPARGLWRWRARLWLGLLYRFFGWTTGLAVRALPPSEEILLSSGLRRVAERTFQRGLVRSVVFDAPGGTGEPCGTPPRGLDQNP